MGAGGKSLTGQDEGHASAFTLSQPVQPLALLGKNLSFYLQGGQRKGGKVLSCHIKEQEEFL